MINFNGFIGNENIKKTVSACFGFNAWIIEGEPGSGRHMLASVISRASVCESSGDIPCGHCPGCVKSEHGTHPDIINIPSDIKLSALRSVLSSFNVYPSEKCRKVYIIDNAENLGSPQQDILLKSLEEPPEFAVFIIICRSAENLLRTVRSRCIVLSVSPVSTALVFGELRRKFPEYDPDKIKAAAEESRGIIGRAEAYLTGKLPAEYGICTEFVRAVAEKRFIPAFEFLDCGRGGRELFETKLSVISDMFGRCIYLWARPSCGKTEAEAAAVMLGPEKLGMLCDLFEDVREKCMFNINVTLWSAYIIKECRRICMGDEIL